ncbi:flagellar motor protein MotB [Serratia symbiotica]|uniref:Flagellar motor protein MotB n=1 Tax=Serratia symbiotica TaxID=138074 RepID=A0A068ZC84_9GAMM|nr:flagellar motor protein MotB [Serratia symbiotica]MBF1995173.1 flagellar motor protein MotB [Serratia symbiotica]MBQ0956846.1 flagellar motor protein MotB [Serratia symbiotica]QLH62405.1 flagellar motor protein MotB [Serratia symbiotica]QTP13557.1 flagellar motor protein MotB [Serratia symbiotica]CDS58538.1 protein that enables flagellar motor rotation [Serratia symbiotica]
MKQDHPVIVVKKKRKAGHGGHHGGSWKIAYADFMTAMMAFFLVMWLLSIANPQQLTQIAEYFRTPLKVALTGGDKNSSESSPIPGGGDDPTQQEGLVKKQIESPEKRAEELKLNKLREKLDELIESDPRLKALRPHLLINLMDEGLRIQIIDSQNRPMFKTGSAQVVDYMRDILRAIAPILNDLPNKISLSGHTDDIPYANGERGYSNWELSADRANASRRELIAGGLSEGKVLRVVGMASTMSLKQRDADDAINRRITVLVLNKDTQKEIERDNAESNATDITQPDSLKQVIPPTTPAPANSSSPPKEKPVSQDAEDQQKAAAEAKAVTDKEKPQNDDQQGDEKRTGVIVTQTQIRESHVF